MYNLWCDHDIMLFEKKNGHTKKCLNLSNFTHTQKFLFQNPVFSLIFHTYELGMSTHTYCPLKPTQVRGSWQKGLVTPPFSLSLEAAVSETMCAPSNWWGSVPALP